VDSVQPAVPAASGAAEASDSLGETGPLLRPRRAPTAALGWVAIGLAAACVVLDVVAVVLAIQRYWVSATLIAQGTTVATILVFVVGLFAAFRRPARWLGIGAMVVAVLANPFILTHLLNFLGG
jgi:hypothetical protein